MTAVQNTTREAHTTVPLLSGTSLCPSADRAPPRPRRAAWGSAAFHSQPKRRGRLVDRMLRNSRDGQPKPRGRQHSSQTRDECGGRSPLWQSSTGHATRGACGRARLGGRGGSRGSRGRRGRRGSTTFNWMFCCGSQRSRDLFMIHRGRARSTHCVWDDERRAWLGDLLPGPARSACWVALLLAHGAQASTSSPVAVVCSQRGTGRTVCFSWPCAPSASTSCTVK